MVSRRGLLRSSIAAVAVALPTMGADSPAGDPWPQTDLIEPAALAKLLASGGEQLHIFCVTFPVLYRQKHIPHAQFAGPANKPESIAGLLAAVEALPKNARIVLYCGCCPMDKCPNIRPAYRALRERGFEHVRVLHLPTNFHTDWTAKGYPVVSASLQ